MTDPEEKLGYDEQRALKLYGKGLEYFTGNLACTPLPEREVEPLTEEERAVRVADDLRANRDLLETVLLNLHDGDLEQVQTVGSWNRGEDQSLTRHGGQPDRLLALVYKQEDSTSTYIYSSLGGKGSSGKCDTEEEAVKRVNDILRQRGYILTGPELSDD